MKKGLFLFFHIICWFSLSGQELFDWQNVKEIRLHFTIENWDHVLDSLKNYEEDKRLIATATVNGVVYDSVGVRYKGNSSYFNVRKSESSKLPFNIKFDYVKKKQKLPPGHSTLKLSNIFRDPSFLREVLSYEIANKYMPAPRANFARLFVNEQFFGLYNSTEPIDKDFLKNHFGSSKGAFFKCDPDWRSTGIPGCITGNKASLVYQGADSICYEHLYEIKSKTGWAKLIELTKVLNHEPDRIEEILNVDEVLWMHAFNNVLVNLDSYSGRLCHNYYLFQDEDNIFHPIVWDMNLSLGGFRYADESGSLSNEELQRLSPFLNYRNEERPLISKLLGNAFYRKIYLAHLRTILDENFTNGWYLTRIEEIRENIDSYVKSDSNKLYSYESFGLNVNQTAVAGNTEIIGIAELMETRSEYLSNHPLIRAKTPGISDIQHLHEGESTFITSKLSDGQKIFLAYRYKPYGRFVRVEMQDDGNHKDGKANDGVFGAEIKRSNGAQFYLIAENEKTVLLSPGRAAFEYHLIK